VSGLKEKIAYLQGLAEGIDLDKDSKEGKLFAAVIEVMDDMALSIEGIALNQSECESYLEALDEDLGDLEDDIYGEDGEYMLEDDDEDEEEADDDYEECQCEGEECDCGNYVEVACPHCFSVINIEPGILDDDDVLEITCPNCDELIYVNDDNDNLEMEAQDHEEE